MLYQKDIAMRRNREHNHELESVMFLKFVVVAFIVLIILVLAQLAYVINQLDELQINIESNIAAQFEKMRLLSEAETISVHRSGLLIKMTLSQDEGERHHLYQEYQRTNMVSIQALQKLQALEKNDNEINRINKQINNMEQIKIVRGRVIDLLLVGNIESAQLLLQHNVIQQQNSIRSLFVNIREQQQAQVQNMLLKTKAEYKSARNAILWTGLFVSIIVSAISFMVFRWIRQHMDSIEARVINLEASRLRLHKKATRDALTGLANKSQLNNYLQQKIKKNAKRKSFAVMYLDLDGFKKINDEYGHAVGDRLLAMAALRMQGMLREHDFIARVGGDEFAIIMQNSEEKRMAVAVAQKLIAFLGEPFSIGTLACQIGVSVGIAFYPHDGTDTAQLLHNADQAMYSAKRNGKNRFVLYNINGLDLNDNMDKY